MTRPVVGRAVAQYTHCPSSMLAISLVFMPKMLLMVPRGRKTMVTMVNAKTAASCLSLVVSIMLIFWFAVSYAATSL